MCPGLYDINSKLQDEKKEEEKLEKSETCALSAEANQSEVILQTIVVRVCAEGSTTLARCLLDSGAQRSYITTSLARRLRLKSDQSKKVSHIVFGEVVTEPKTQKSYKVKVVSIGNNFQFPIEVMEQNQICGKIPLLTQEEIEELLYKENISLAHHEEAPTVIEMLLGADVLGKLLTGKIKETTSGLTAIQTYLGWTVMGQTASESHCSVF